MELDLGFTKIDLFDALPHHKGVFADLATLDYESEIGAEDWFAKMLSGGQGYYSFSPGAKIEALTAIYTSARNLHRQFGVSPLGIGFPFVLHNTTERTVASPLLIWPIVLEPEPVGPHKWYLHIREDKPVQINEFLCDYLKEWTGQDWLKALKMLGSRPDWQALRGFFEHMHLKLAEEQKVVLRPCPDLKLAGNILDTHRVFPCGVIGLFPPLKEGLPRTAGVPQEHPMPSRNWHSFGIGALDPYQAGGAKAVLNGKRTIIQGGAGTGKTYLTRHLLTNFLSNGGTSLVVSDNLPQLQEIQQSLEEYGLGRLCYTFCDPREDLKLLRDYLRAEIQSDRPVAAFDTKKFHLIADKLERLREKLDKAYQATHTPILGEDNWTNLVGKYLKSSTLQGKELLGGQLHPADFCFDKDEYDILLSAVEAAYPLFRRINGIDHPLSSLHPRIFLKCFKEEALELAGHKIPAYGKRVAELLHRYIATIDAYSDHLRGAMEAGCRRLTIQVEVAMDLVRDFSLEFGDNFIKAGDTFLQLSGPFSKSGKRMIAGRQEIRKIQQAICESAREMESFGLDTAALSSTGSFEKIVAGLSDFQGILKQWTLELPDFVQAETLRMNAAQINTLAMPSTLPANLEAEMDALLEEINAEELLHFHLEHRLLTLSKRGKYLEQLLRDLENLQSGLRDFKEFYDWQRFWLGISDNAKKLIRALTVLKPADWSSSFRSWYLDQTLLKYQDLALPREPLPIETFVSLWEELQHQLPAQIISIWEDRRLQARKTIKSNSAWNKWIQGKGARMGSEEIADIFANRLAIHSAINPVTLATVAASWELLSGVPEESFDLVVVAGVNALSSEQLWWLEARGRRSIVLADDSAMRITGVLPGNLVFLGNSHRNDAFNPFLPAQAALPSPGSIRTTVSLLDGAYEQDLGINIAESEYILDYLLYRLEGLEAASAPAIIIVAFTPAQRDYIAAALMRCKYAQGPESERICQLERSGLSVLALGELEVLKADLVFVSVVFSSGPITFWSSDSNADADFLRRMRSLLAMSRRETIFCCSVPQRLLERWQSASPATPEGFLGSYLSAVMDDKMQGYSQRLAGLRPEGHSGFSHEAFWQALEERIKPFFPDGQVEQISGERNVPPALQIIPGTRHSTRLLLHADGFISNHGATDYFWEAACAKKLAEQGFQLRQVWSVNWWKQPGQEARRLAGELLRQNESPSAE